MRGKWLNLACGVHIVDPIQNELVCFEIAFGNEDVCDDLAIRVFAVCLNSLFDGNGMSTEAIDREGGRSPFGDTSFDLLEIILRGIEKRLGIGLIDVEEGLWPIF